MSTLAIHGGTPVRTAPFPSWPQWGKEEEDRLIRAVDACQWGTLGNMALAFAKRFAAFQGCAHGIAVNSGTQALEIILRSMGLGYGDQVIVPAYTFVATVTALCAVGVTPIFADIDPLTLLLDPNDMERRITDRTRAILVVHYAGRPADMTRIMDIADRRGIPVVEDCAQAHGAAFDGKMVGSMGVAGAFSFQGTKNLPAGEGGMIVTNNRDLFAECWHYHTSGRALEGSGELSGTVLMGTNARMAEFEAAVLDAQLDKLPAKNEKRWENYAYLHKEMSRFPWIELPPVDKRLRHGLHLFTFQIKPELLGMDRETFTAAMNAEGIPTTGSYQPLYQNPMFRSRGFLRQCCQDGFSTEPLPVVENVAQRAVYFTQNMLLGEKKDMDDILEALEKMISDGHKAD